MNSLTRLCHCVIDISLYQRVHLLDVGCLLSAGFFCPCQNTADFFFLSQAEVYFGTVVTNQTKFQQSCSPKMILSEWNIFKWVFVLLSTLQICICPKPLWLTLSFLDQICKFFTKNSLHSLWKRGKGEGGDKSLNCGVGGVKADVDGDDVVGGGVSKYNGEESLHAR